MKNLLLLKITVRYQQKKLIKLKYWRRNLTVNTVKGEVYFKIEKGLLPGDSLISYFYFRLNNGHFPIQTEKNYKRRMNRGYRKRHKTTMFDVDTRIYLFEKILSQSVEKMLVQIELDELPKTKKKETDK